MAHRTCRGLDGRFTAVPERQVPCHDSSPSCSSNPTTTRVMYAEYLQAFGFTVLTADTTDDGLSRASDADVIVTGMWVSGSFDGVELVRRVRQTDKTKHTPIIVLLTACAFESDRQRAFAAGCDLVLPKHCPPERLVSEIRAVGATTLQEVEVIMDKPNRRR